MASCYQFKGTATNQAGETVYTFLPDVVLDASGCLAVTDGFVVMTPSEYVQQKADADALTDIASVTAFVDPVEVSAVYGTSFALIFFLSAIAYKIKVAKRVIKLS